MKNLCRFMLSISIIISVFGYISSNLAIAEDSYEIIGLQEKMDALNLIKSGSQELLDNMLQQRLNAFNAGWSNWLETTKALGKMDGKSDEEMYQYQWSLVKPKFDEGFLVSCLNTDKYMVQYVENEKFPYLFDTTKYWSVSERSRYLENGTYFADSRTVFNKSVPRFIISERIKEFLADTSVVEIMLAAKGETIVSDVKLFAAVDLLSFLYIKCESNEYLIKIDDSVGITGYLPQIETLKLYPILDVMDAITTILHDESFSYNKKLAENAVATKPTYESEAESLHQQGLLNGNENGLDLLKPLSRIEAAAMLLRALGQSETANSGSGQIFSDVPQDHWGYGAAENAYNLGLIQGVGNDQFAPDKNVTATEFSTMVLRASGTPEFDWEQALNLLIEQDIITKDNANTMDFFTRGDMAKIIYEAKAKDLL